MLVSFKSNTRSGSCHGIGCRSAISEFHSQRGLKQTAIRTSVFYIWARQKQKGLAVSRSHKHKGKTQNETDGGRKQAVQVIAILVLTFHFIVLLLSCPVIPIFSSLPPSHYSFLQFWTDIIPLWRYLSDLSIPVPSCLSLSLIYIVFTVRKAAKIQTAYCIFRYAVLCNSLAG